MLSLPRVKITYVDWFDDEGEVSLPSVENPDKGYVERSLASYAEYLGLAKDAFRLVSWEMEYVSV